MKDSFDRASDAYDSRDGEAAASYAADGHRYKAESQDCVQERRQLVQEIRDARDAHNDTKPDFQHAKGDFTRAKQRFDDAKSDHEHKQVEFKRAKADFDQAVKAFRARLEVVHAERKRRKDEKRSLAEQAGVPAEYLDNVWISREPNGTVNIYFGGIDKPNGDGHGHYAMDASGHVIYRRDPFDPHGSQNFTDERDGRGIGRLAKGVASAAIAIYGAYGQPQQNSANTQHRWSEQNARAEGERRGAQASDATRDKGIRDRGTSQQD